MTFRFRTDKSSIPNSKLNIDEDVLVHLSIDKFEPDLMSIDPDNPDEYFLTRMVPPKQVEYYFSIAGVPQYRVDIENESASIANYPDLKRINDRGGSIPWRVNVSPIAPRNTVQIDLDYLDEFNCRPRQEAYCPKAYCPVKQIIPKTKLSWKQETSVFSKYRIDNAKLLDNCFEVDWE
jgi:hypothetical protein